MKQIKAFTILSVIFATLSFASCSSSTSTSSEENPLLGKWEQRVETPEALIVATYEFNADNTITQTLDTKGEGIDIEAEGTCQYTFKDNTLKFKFSGSDFEFEKFEINGQDLSDSEIMEQQKKQMTDIENVITDVKIEDDTLSGNFNGVPFVLTRVK